MNLLRAIAPSSAAIVLGLLLPGRLSPLPAEEPAKEEKKPPQILLGSPLGLVKGETNQVLLRGLNLESVETVAPAPANTNVLTRLKDKGKSDPPKDEKKEAAGDTHLEVEVVLPADFEAHELILHATDSMGHLAEWTGPVFARKTLLLEGEENNELNHPERIPLDAVVLGCVESSKDVDVYGFDAPPNQALLLEVKAARYGSLLDPMLMLYDEAGNVLKSDDDSGGQRDVRIIWMPPAGGSYRAAILDASDKGGALHGYAFIVRPAPEPRP